MFGLRWFKNSKGREDATLTFAAISFYISSIAVILGMLKTINIGTFHLEFNGADPTLVLGYIAACFTSYVMRRNTKDKIDLDELKHVTKKE